MSEQEVTSIPQSSEAPAETSAPQAQTLTQETSPEAQQATGKETGLDAIRSKSKAKAKEEAAVIPAVPVVDPTIPKWQPNFKLKIKNKDFEVPEMFRHLVKDAETEKQVREVFNKAYGVDYMTPKFNELEATAAEHSELKGSVQKLAGLYQKGDMDGFFKTLNIPDEVVFKYALDKLNYEQLPPEQKLQVEQQQAISRRAEEAEGRLAEMEQTYRNREVQTMSSDLDNILQIDEVQKIAEVFDSRMGRPGAFRAEVINKGDYEFQRNGKMLTPQQAVASVLHLVGMQVPQQGVPSTPQPRQNPPVIPHVTGASSSPVKKSLNSLDAIRKRAAELNA